ncbi:MAG: pyruvate, water dikinase regulatory protein [Bacillota bacterium]
METENLNVFVISDFTGKTAETVIDSVVVQFDVDQIEIKRFPDISNIEELEKIINEAKKVDAVIAYTLVSPELCDYLEKEASIFDIATIDILEPFLTRFSKILDQQPQLEVGLSYKISHEAFKKMDCIDYCLRCDDGKDLNRLTEADIILIGVSRTAKTPVSMYLSNSNYKVANLSLLPEVEVPQEIYDIPVERIVGLTIDAERLHKIRKQRLQIMDFPSASNYTNLGRIKKELSYAQNIMNQLGCRVIDVTNTAVEEIAAKILTKTY